MTIFPSSNTLLIAGIVFLTIAVIGQSKLGFLEINPGCFGRTLALFIGIVTLAFAVGLVNLPLENFDLLKTYLAKEIQQNISLINDFLQGS
ncbi:hypothetical protein A6770_14750 [Nostoc minutum NIES-26]|uniref:Uncharacterized protein n=1 Tax=Nostoc minutum NIES-26 TaxID=1844469 RepID=A0A367RNR6_9NOSO|nr:hypothetical protein A6770_14750 [Nostoc minutum NIES-26]